MSLDPNDVSLIQSRLCGVCSLICFSVPYVCLSSKWRVLLCKSGVSVDVCSGYYPSNKFIKLYRVLATGPNLSLLTDHMSLLCSLDFSGIQLSRCRTCSRLNLLLLSTLHLCRFPFYMQVMILTRSYYKLSSLAITSVDGCCLHIIIHNSISHRT